jgi:predicted ATPase
MLRLKVRDFGPIGTADVELHPFTLFVGQNNSGKSYLATLAYALHASRMLFPPVRSTHRDHVERLLAAAKDREDWPLPTDFHGDEIAVGELDKQFRDEARSITDSRLSAVARQSGDELQRCFASGLKELVRHGATGGFELTLQHDPPCFDRVYSYSSGRGFHSEQRGWQLDTIVVPLDEVRGLSGAARIGRIIDIAISKLLGQFRQGAFYLPAARSGFLHSHKLMASVLVRRSHLLGVTALDIPTLSGVIADFVSNVLELEHFEASEALASIAAFIESRISGGSIDLVAGSENAAYPQIYYEQKGHRFPVQSTSSMVSEIAPIVLFVRHAIQPGDLLIIEEPEAHLHPDNQRLLAQALVKLVRANVHVLATTHSDYFLQQVSNFVMLDEKPALRRELEYDETDFLRRREIGVYHFETGPDGSTVAPVAIGDTDGIADDQFAEVVEDLYNEKARIERSSMEA